MSFEIPRIQVPDDSPEAQVIREIVSSKKVSKEEAVRVALRSAASEPARVKLLSSKSKKKQVEPLTEEELKRIDELLPSLRLLDDVTDEQWVRIQKGVDEMRREGFPRRA